MVARRLLMMRFVLVLAVSLLVPLPGGTVHAQQQFDFYVSAVDSAGVPVTDLKAEEIVVTENGARATIGRIELVTRPVKVQVLVDNGIGTGSQLLQFRSGLRGFFAALPLGVEASLLTLAPQPRWIVRATTDRVQLTKGVDMIAPDDGAAKFIDGLVEASGRINEDNKGRNRYFPIIVVLSTTGPEGSSSRERDMERMIQQLREQSATVHVVMLGTGPQTTNTVTGARQVGLGKFLADDTGGRYEAIAATTRVMTLMPEIGELVAKAHIRQNQQYRITAERPSGTSGPLGVMAMAITRPGVSGSASLDGRAP
jgi:hypothetical protein